MDQRQLRIRLEAVACEAVFGKAEEGAVRLVWSFMHEDEGALCPFPARMLEAAGLSCLCAVRVEASEDVRAMAQTIQKGSGLSAKDAVHLACACVAGADVLLTCDDDFLRLASRAASSVRVMNPVEYVRSKLREWQT